MSNDVVGRIEFSPSNPFVNQESEKYRTREISRPPSNMETFESLMKFMNYKLVESKVVDSVSCEGCKYENVCEDGDECKEFGESDDCDEDVKRGM